MFMQSSGRFFAATGKTLIFSCKVLALPVLLGSAALSLGKPLKFTHRCLHLLYCWEGLPCLFISFQSDYFQSSGLLLGFLMLPCFWISLFETAAFSAVQ